MFVGTPTSQNVFLKDCVSSRGDGWAGIMKTKICVRGGEATLFNICFLTFNTMTGIMLHVFPFPYVDVEFIALPENTILAEYTKDTIFLLIVFILA